MRTRLLILLCIGILLLLVGVFYSGVLAQPQQSGPGVYDIITVTPTHIQTQYDKPPRFCATPNVTSVKNGNWSDASVWSTGQVPGNEAKIFIAPGTSVTIDSQLGTKVDCVEIEGTLNFSPSTNTRLYTNHIQVMPFGTLNAVVTNPAITAELIIRDTPIDPATDPQQFGHSLIAFGEVHMEGAPIQSTFIRLTAEPKAGSTTLTLETAPNNWRVGDKLVLPDSRQMHPGDVNTQVFAGDIRMANPKEWRFETVNIAAINGTTITLTQPLKYDHPGARDMDGNIDFLPHVANLTRNVVITSENPDGTRGHIMMMGRAHPVLKYIALRELGRTTVAALDSTTFNADGTLSRFGTNQIGRYMLHMHHDWGPKIPDPSGYQFEVVGLAVDTGRRWGIVTHGSHYGLIKDNVVFGAPGAGIVTEDGSETGNLFEHNFVVGSRGSGGQSADRVSGTGVGPDVGHEGSCFWARATNNTYRDNVATSCTIGFNFFNGFGAGVVKIPTSRGMDQRTAKGVNDQELSLPPYDVPRTGNEVYGISALGFELWNSGAPSILNTKGWNVYASIFFGPPAQRHHLTVKGLVARLGYDAAKAQGKKYARVQHVNFFYPRFLTYEDADVEGALNMFYEVTNTATTVKNATVKTYGVAFDHAQHMSNVGKKVILDNVKVIPVAGQPVQYTNFSYKSGRDDNALLTTANNFTQFLIYNYQQIPGRNYEIFSKEQYADFVIPIVEHTPTYRRFECPTAGPLVTNAQCQATISMSIGGRIPPCATKDCATEEALAKSLGITNAAAFPFTGTTPPAIPAGPPHLVVYIPQEGDQIVNTSVAVLYIGTGNLSEVNHVHFSLDGQAEVRDTDFDGTYRFQNVPLGKHTLTGYLARADHSKIPGTDMSRTFDVVVTPTASSRSSVSSSSRSSVVSSAAASSAASTPPALKITSPTSGQAVAGTTLEVMYTKMGNLTGAGVDHVHFSLDGQPEVRDLDFDGYYSFLNVPMGNHTLTGFLARADHSKVPGTDTSVNFSTTAGTSSGPELCVMVPLQGVQTHGNFSKTKVSLKNVQTDQVVFEKQGTMDSQGKVTVQDVSLSNLNSSSTYKISVKPQGYAQKTSGILSYATVTGTACITLTAAPIGDLDNNGKVERADILKAIKHYRGEQDDPALAELFGKGKAIGLARIILMINNYIGGVQDTTN